MTHDIWQTMSPRLLSNEANTAWLRRLRDGDPQIYTYRQIYDGSLHLANQLRQKGVQQGDIVSVIGPNGPEWGIGALATWKVGAILAPVHIGNTVSDIQRQISILNPKILLTYDADRKIQDIDVPVLPIEISSEFSEEEAQQPNNDLSTEEAVRIYTSGSTGAPKMVRLSHKNISTNFVACSKIVSIDQRDCFLSLLPLSHTFELVGGMLLPLYVGASIAIPKVLTAKEVMDAMLEENVSVVLAVPRLFRNIKVGMEKKFRDKSILVRGYIALLGALPLGIRRRVNAPILKQLSPNLRYWVSGGARLDPAIGQFFRDLGISLRQGYGLTETSPVSCVQEAFPANLDSVGYAIEGVEVKIHEPDEHGCGEVLIRGDNVMLGYTDERLTQEVMMDDWFRTGDIGRLDTSGNLSLTGRSKRMIVTEAGKNVYPEELETLLERYSDIKEAGVIEENQRPCAILAMDNPGESSEKAREVLNQYNKVASAHNKITRFALVEDLPKTPLGKNSLAELPRVFRENEVR